MEEKNMLAKIKQVYESFDKEQMYEYLDKYNNSVVLKGLFKSASCVLALFHPEFAFPAMTMETVLITWAGNRQRKWKIIANELEKGELSEKLLEDANLIHCFMQIIEASERTQSDEKIRYFARLFKTSVTDSSMIKDIDEYEEYLSIIKELSYREFAILKIIDEHEANYPNRPGSRRDWAPVMKKLTEQLKISKDEIRYLLLRISSRGCFDFVGTVGQGSPYGQGYLTPLYHKLKKIILEKKDVE